MGRLRKTFISWSNKFGFGFFFFNLRYLVLVFLNGSPHHNFYLITNLFQDTNKSKTMKTQNISEIRAKLVSPYMPM